MNVQVKKRSFIVTYWKLGYLLHLMTIIEIIVIVSVFYYFDLSKWLAHDDVVLKYVLLFLLIVAPIYPQCDARSRYQNYKQVKDHLYLYGFQPRIIKPFSFSRCQRDAVITAAEELGMSEACNLYFKQLGYRWYHVLPVFLNHQPAYLFQKAFWLNTFFAKTYYPKVDFELIIQAQENNLLQKENYSIQSGSLSN